MTTVDTQSPHILTVDEIVTFPGVPADHRFAYGPDPAQFGDLYVSPLKSGAESLCPGRWPRRRKAGIMSYHTMHATSRHWSQRHYA
jgi:hypothetical protein